MRSNAGAGPLLVQAALREHNRLVDVELTSQNWDKAVWLFRQEIRLRNGVEPGSEDLCLLLYQFATLQYTRCAPGNVLQKAYVGLCAKPSGLTMKKSQTYFNQDAVGNFQNARDSSMVTLQCK